MKRSPLFLSAVITLLVMIFACHTAKAFSTAYSDGTIEIKNATVSFSASAPLSHSNDQDIPKIKAASSFSSLPSTLCIHTDHDVACIFEIRFEVNRFENYQPPIPVALSPFFLHMFSVLVSPNAP